MFNYPGEYVQLPWGVYSTTLGNMFNYPGSMFNYPGELKILPWGVLLKMSAEGMGSRVIRAKNFGFRPTLLLEN